MPQATHIKLNVVRQTVSKWENGLSVPDSNMLITLADELDTSVSVLLGETVMEPMPDDLKAISEKLEVINLQLAKRNMFKVKTIRWILITLCAFIVLAFIALAVMQSFYLRWDYNNPEFAVAGTILHGSFVEMVLWWLKDKKKQTPEELDYYFRAVIEPIL